MTVHVIRWLKYSLFRSPPTTLKLTLVSPSFPQHKIQARPLQTGRFSKVYCSNVPQTLGIDLVISDAMTHQTTRFSRAVGSLVTMVRDTSMLHPWLARYCWNRRGRKHTPAATLGSNRQTGLLTGVVRHEQKQLLALGAWALNGVPRKTFECIWELQRLDAHNVSSSPRMYRPQIYQ